MDYSVLEGTFKAPRCSVNSEIDIALLGSASPEQADLTRESIVGLRYSVLNSIMNRVDTYVSFL